MERQVGDSSSSAHPHTQPPRACLPGSLHPARVGVRATALCVIYGPLHYHLKHRGKNELEKAKAKPDPDFFTYLPDQYFANRELAIETVDFPRLPFPPNLSGSKLNYCFLVH